MTEIRRDGCERPSSAGPQVHILMLACTALTALLAIGVWQLGKRTSVVDDIRQIMHPPGEIIDPDAVGHELATGVEIASVGEVDILAKQIARAYSAQDIIKISEHLIKDEKTMRAHRLGTLIAEEGGRRYFNAVLLNRAGLEYWLGRFVKRDYQKAELYLSDPSLKSTFVSKYYLGEVFLAADNPNRDPERGLALIREAAESGLQVAQKRLKALSQESRS